MARGLVPRGHLLASCHRERSVNCHGERSFKTTRPSCFCHYERSEVIQKQVLLAKRLLLSFHSIAMTRDSSKNCEQVQGCHRERSVAIYWQTDCFHHATSVARGRLTFRLRKNILLGFAMTRFSGKSQARTAGNLFFRDTCL